MPIVKVEMLKGKSTEYKKTVLDCIHEGLMESIGIEDWDRLQRIVEFDRNDFEFPSFKGRIIMGYVEWNCPKCGRMQIAMTEVK